MPNLVTPPPRDQVATPDAGRFGLCGEACLASALGLDVPTVVRWLREHMGELAVRDGTTPQALIAFCRSRGIGAGLVYGPANRYVQAAATRRHYALVVVWSDHQGNPIPLNQSAMLHRGGIGHWLLGYGTIGTRVQVMQPWGGRLLLYDLNASQDQRYGLEIFRPIAMQGATAPQPSRPATTRPAGARIYVVKSGDSLSAIGRKEGKSVEQLLAANPEIKNRNLILVGQRLRIPN